MLRSQSVETRTFHQKVNSIEANVKSLAVEVQRTKTCNAAASMKCNKAIHTIAGLEEKVAVEELRRKTIEKNISDMNIEIESLKQNLKETNDKCRRDTESWEVLKVRLERAQQQFASLKQTGGQGSQTTGLKSRNGNLQNNTPYELEKEMRKNKVLRDQIATLQEALAIQNDLISTMQGHMSVIQSQRKVDYLDENFRNLLRMHQNVGATAT
eukprot:PhF_6_TR5991/c0_g1_i1/m.8646